MRSMALPALLALLAAPQAALAGGFSNLDFGIRRVGMMAVTGRPDDVSAIFHNPAGLTLEDGTRLYHHQTWAYIDMGVRLYDSEGVLRPDHDMEPDWNVGVIPFLGFASDLGTYDWQLGVGIYSPNAYGAALPEDEPTRYHATQALFIATRATAALAYEATDRLSVAAAVSLVHVYLTATRMMSALVLQDPDHRFDAPADSEAFDAPLAPPGRVGPGHVELGMLLRLTDDLRFGAAFTRGSGVALEGDVTLTQPDGRVESTTHTTTMIIPSGIRAGLNLELAWDLELGIDIYYWHYQVYQEQRTTLGEPLMGMTTLVSPKNYGNSWNWCIGLLYRPAEELDLMMGFQQDYSPIPEETFSLDTPTTDMVGFSAGARWRVSESLRLGLAVMRNWYTLIHVQNSQTDPPSNAKGHGGNSEIAFEVSYRF